MSIVKTLGGDRLGSGKKNRIEMHGFERSTHNLSSIWRSTMSAGTLVPFFKKIALPGDTFDIDLDVDGKTHPTVGPLFGSYKVQLDLFKAPIRLYQGQLHNNKLGIGMNMANVKLPQMTLYTMAGKEPNNLEDYDNVDINPSCILKYLGISGIGNTALTPVDPDPIQRQFCALYLLMYWDIFKNYYSNKMEDNAYVIHSAPVVPDEVVNELTMPGTDSFGTTITITMNGPTMPPPTIVYGYTTNGAKVDVTYAGLDYDLSHIMLRVDGKWYILEEILTNISNIAGQKTGYLNIPSLGAGKGQIQGWNYINALGIVPFNTPKLESFPLSNLDDMRELILSEVQSATAFNVNAADITPYKFLLDDANRENTSYKYSQEGLAVKTYQSDLFNNWLNTEIIDGTEGVNAITSIDTSGGFITIDTINLANKLYNLLNRIALSGGTYDDWQDANWAHNRYIRPETPIYEGGLIRELGFQEVVSNSISDVGEGSEQPLGTLAGKGIMTSKRKGGSVTIKVDEPSLIMGIVSLTPRIDYSQGNEWDVHLKTMDDFHKPGLDQIGFQDLITEQMHWSDTFWSTVNEEWIQNSAGKQPAWINYMTDYNKVYGNFAVESDEMFMVLNRRYELTGGGRISDLTTYIDPVKFNYSFAQTSIDAQNFWIQISTDVTARRKMSAKQIPNL